ncbi:MAG: NTP transferase domain-containing protein, partial [Prevotella sp.]|nr:NTP transferase domain-containing protein [Prevotella sp.]
MKQAMILAAGLGTRLKPLTDSMPKALVRVGGQPLLWHVVMKLRAAGYERVVVNVHHFAQQIVDYLAANDNFGIDIRISDETEQLLETGGALKKAQALFDPDEPVLIHNVDILDNVDFDWLRRRHLDDEDAVLLVSRRTTQRYLMFDNAMRLMGWKNTATGEVKSPYEYVRRT